MKLQSKMHLKLKGLFNFSMSFCNCFPFFKRRSKFQENIFWVFCVTFFGLFVFFLSLLPSDAPDVEEEPQQGQLDIKGMGGGDGLTLISTTEPAEKRVQRGIVKKKKKEKKAVK